MKNCSICYKCRNPGMYSLGEQQASKAEEKKGATGCSLAVLHFLQFAKLLCKIIFTFSSAVRSCWQIEAFNKTSTLSHKTIKICMAFLSRDEIVPRIFFCLNVKKLGAWHIWFLKLSKQTTSMRVRFTHRRNEFLGAWSNLVRRPMLRCIGLNQTFGDGNRKKTC